MTANRPETIDQLINSIDRYNPENLPILEEYLVEQCRDASVCDLHANLALLKLYQFNPAELKPQVVANILAKAVTQVPASDFSLCLYLLSPEMLAQEPISQLVQLHTLLDSCHYAAFWSMWRQDEMAQDAAGGVAGFESAVRRNIADAISRSFQSISLTQLEGLLGLKGAKLTEAIVLYGWSTPTPTTVLIPLNKDNEAKSVLITEHIQLEQLSKHLAHANY